MERIDKISEQYEDYFDTDIKNKVFKGLQILSKYSDDVLVNPAHDEIFAGIENWNDMSDDDIHAMFKLNWHWDEESFATFC